MKEAKEDISWVFRLDEEGDLMLNPKLKFKRTINRNGSYFMSDEELKAIQMEICLNEHNSETVHGNLVLGLYNERLHILNTRELHSIVYGDTGSGKTRRILYEYLLSTIFAKESVVINDCKSEIISFILPFAEKQGYDIKILNFKEVNDKNSEHWNPLALPTELYHKGEETKALRLIKSLGLSIIKEVAHSDRDPYWENAAVSVFQGCVQFLLKYAKPEQVTMHAVAVLVQDIMKSIEIVEPGTEEIFGKPITRTLSIMDILFDTEDEKKSSIYQQLQIIIDNAKETKGCILSVLRTALEPYWSYEDIIYFVNESSFDIEMIGKKPTIVFLLTSDSQRDMDALVSCFINQVYVANANVADKESNRRLPVDLHFVLDEFNSMVPIADINKKVSTARSRGIRFLFVVQSLAALRSTYTSDIANNIIANCHAWIVMRSAEYELHKLVQERLGKVVLPSGKEENLITIAQLNDLQVGEALLIYKGKGIFLNLPDISEYSLPFEPMEYYEAVPFENGCIENLFDVKELCFEKIAKKLGKTVEELKGNTEEKDGREICEFFQNRPKRLDALVNAIDKKIEEMEEEMEEEKSLKDENEV